MGIPVFDETPDFERQVTVAAMEAQWMKRELESLVSSGKAVSKVRPPTSRSLRALVTDRANLVALGQASQEPFP